VLNSVLKPQKLLDDLQVSVINIHLLHLCKFVEYDSMFFFCVNFCGNKNEPVNVIEPNPTFSDARQIPPDNLEAQFPNFADLIPVFSCSLGMSWLVGSFGDQTWLENLQ
jgi:hypothetical protein